MRRVTPGTGEQETVAMLTEMLAVARRDPHAALGLVHGVSALELRAAFLERTKKYHPAKFARLSGSTVRLANEVFLALRGAHDTVAKQITPSGGIPALSGRAGSGPVGRPFSTSNGPAVARVGMVLAEHFPARENDVNELPDRLIEV